MAYIHSSTIAIYLLLLVSLSFSDFLPSKHADNAAKISHLEELRGLGALQVYRAELAEEGSFDEAVAGCEYVFLVAAPVNAFSENPEVKLVVTCAPYLSIISSCIADLKQMKLSETNCSYTEVRKFLSVKSMGLCDLISFEFPKGVQIRFQFVYEFALRYRQGL